MTVAPHPSTFVNSAKPLQAMPLDEFLSLEFPPRRNLLDPWLPEKGLAMIYAERGIGKTWFALSIGLAVATAGSVLGFSSSEARPVVYVDGEMPGHTMQSRLKALLHGLSTDAPVPTNFRILSGDCTVGGLPDLGSDEGQQRFESVLSESALIIIDNISTCVRSGRENDAEGWSRVQEWALEQRRKGRTVLFVHHAGKSGAQRGTSKKEDVLDTVIALKRPSAASRTEGAIFQVGFEKNRSFHGKDAEPFEARLNCENGVATWKTGTVTVPAEDSVALKWLEEGRSIRAVSKLANIPKSRVERLKKGLSA